MEIKELCNAEPDPKEKDESLSSDEDEVQSTEIMEEQILISSNTNKEDRKEHAVNVNNKYECGQCDKTYTKSSSLHRHKQSAHKGVRYTCDKCDFQYTDLSTLNKHIKSKHDGVKFACDQCDHQATQKGNLMRHIQVMHESAMEYVCDQS